MRKSYINVSYLLTVLILFLCFFLFPAQSKAATWICGNENWNTNYWNYTCWDFWDYPDANEDVYVVDTIYAHAKTVNYVNPGYNPTLGNLYIESTSGNVTTLNQAQDILTTSKTYVGIVNGGNGAYTQSAGTHKVNNSLVLGRDVGSSGKYTLSGTGSLTASSSTIGSYGNGEFTQKGGSFTAGNETIGRQGTGTYTQDGGKHTVTGALGIAVQSIMDFSSSRGDYILNDGTLSTSYTRVGGNGGRGYFTQTGGTHTVENSLTVSWARANRGIYVLEGGNLSTGFEFIGMEGYGYFEQSGGTHTVVGDITVETAGLQTGEYSMRGGTLTAANIINKGKVTYSGGSITADIANHGSFELSGSGTRTVTGEVTNESGGTVDVSDTTAVFTGKFMNKSSYISDQSDNYFSDLAVSGSGYVTGGSGDRFFISGDFINGSGSYTLWNTYNAYMEFITGTDTAHDVYLAGTDYGALGSGYTDNYAWGMLSIGNGNTLALFDGNLTAGGAMYVSSLFGVDFIGLQVNNIYGSSGLNLYYDALNSNNSYLGGQTYNLAGGGQLIGVNAPVVPEPVSSILFITGGALLAGRRRVKRKKTA